MTLKEFIGANDRFAKKTGIEIVSVAEDFAVARLAVTSEHLNAGGVCQGGAIFTLADTALALIANSRLMLTFTIDATISYHKAVPEGELLTAEARALCMHPKIPAFEVKVTNTKGELVASFRSTCYNKQVALKDIEGLE